MCLKPVTLKNPRQSLRNNSPINHVPCGKCALCVSKYRREWAFRLSQEARDHATAYFVTLTYDSLHLPFLNRSTGEYPVRATDNTLTLSEYDLIEPIVYKKDVQDFIKNLRRQTKYHLPSYEQKAIRYYISSEYGTNQTKRPHYHAILFGVHPYIAKRLYNQKIWTKGQIDIRPITDNGHKEFWYVTKYLYKQRNFKYWTFNPFTLMSTKPFIGERYLRTSEEFHRARGTNITKFNGKDFIIPRIYQEKLPYWIQKNTQKEIQKLMDEAEDKQLSAYEQSNKENHHPDILHIFESIKIQKSFNKELLEFKNHVLNP